ncbi:flagellar filament capping protein FliD [Nocardioides houyundeii]|uniref:flagellar filament capping protein FliD n=1 Tax=Nocardioides houyundeii TaxID=2045452 RepID=UPI000DF36E8A|nr:flagellar filament capping protein FliD [Nocardioides houyundeii]
MASVSGLSGFDGASIVDQLMQLETVGQTRLQSRVKTEQSAVTALQALNTRLAGLATKAGDTGKGDTWSTLAATSSLPGVSASATASTAATSFSVTVDKLALSHQLAFTTPAALTDQVTDGATTVRLDKLDGTVQDLTTDGTLAGLVTALNDPANATGVRASAVRVADGSYRLLVESTSTGQASDFALTNLDGSPLLGGAAPRAGQDAQVTIGGIQATSATNTFSELLPGVSVTLATSATPGSTAEITVARSASTLTASVKSLVDDVNALLKDLDSATASGASGAKGVLAGDSMVRSLRTALAQALYPGDGSSMAAVGLQVDRYGKLVLDETALAKAYEADPAKVAAAFGSGGDGFAARVAQVAKSASEPYGGAVTSAIQGRNDGIKRLNDSVAQWDLRLEMRRSTLTRQFSALETALNSMNSQSSWLSSQIDSLPTYS